MDTQTLLAVIGVLEAEGIDVWLDGGWGVDALLGHQTREHGDLDLVVELDRASRVIELLDAGVLPRHGTPPKSFVTVDARGCQVDTHPVAFNAEGGVFTRWRTARSGSTRAKGLRVGERRWQAGALP